MNMTLKINFGVYFLFLCFTCKTTLINSRKLESRVDWLIPEHQEVRDLKFFFSIYEVRSSKNPFDLPFLETKVCLSTVMKIFLSVVLHLSKAETFLGWPCVVVRGTNVFLFFWCMTVWHKVIKKQTCKKFMGFLFHFFWFGGC